MVFHASILDEDHLILRNAGEISVSAVSDFQTISNFISIFMKLDVS